MKLKTMVPVVIRVGFIGALFCCVTVAHGDDQFDAALVALKTEAAARPPEAVQNDPAQRKVWLENRANEVCAKALRLFEASSTNPKRWEAAVVFVGAAGMQGMDAMAPNVVKGLELIAAAETARDISPVVWGELKTSQIFHHIAQAWARQMKGEKMDLTPLRAAIDDYTKQFPDDGQKLTSFEWAYVYLLTKQDEAAAVTWMQKLTDHPNQQVAKQAKAQLIVEGFKLRPPEMSFRALDGREVDFAKLRGKVVLVDFWATWCGPCVAELPNVKAAYEKYQAQGFEVIGISLDSPKDRAKLEKFVKDHGLNWPQHFDEKNKRNHIAEEWGIVGIPAVFLFGKDGRLVAKDTKGEALAKAVESALRQ
jgi:peroxiredoxin